MDTDLFGLTSKDAEFFFLIPVFKTLIVFFFCGTKFSFPKFLLWLSFCYLKNLTLLKGKVLTEACTTSTKFISRNLVYAPWFSCFEARQTSQALIWKWQLFLPRRFGVCLSFRHFQRVSASTQSHSHFYASRFLFPNILIHLHSR